MGSGVRRRRRLQAWARPYRQSHRRRARWSTARRRSGAADAQRRRAESRARVRSSKRSLRFQSAQSVPAAQMTAAAEAFYLPALFVTVALAGGVRIADRIVLI